MHASEKRLLCMGNRLEGKKTVKTNTDERVYGLYESRGVRKYRNVKLLQHNEFKHFVSFVFLTVSTKTLKLSEVW